MKKYVRQSDNTVWYIQDVRVQVGASIPDDADCSAYGYEFLIETPAPIQYGYYTKEGAVVNNTQTWELIPIAIEKLKEQKLTHIMEKFAVDVGSVKSGYPTDEILSWDKQEQEARAYAQNNTYPTPLIDSIALNRQVPKDILVGKIIEKADLTSTIIGTLIGKRQRLEDIISAIDPTAPNAREILESIVW